MIGFDDCAGSREDVIIIVSIKNIIGRGEGFFMNRRRSIRRSGNISFSIC